MLNKTKILKEIEKNRDKIRSFGVNKLILFGSYARDEQKAESDLDFLVEFDAGRGLFDDYVHFSQFLEDLFGKQIELVKPSLVRKELRHSILEGVKIEAKI